MRCPSGWQSGPVRGFWSEERVGSPFGGRGRRDLSPAHRAAGREWTDSHHRRRAHSRPTGSGSMAHERGATGVVGRSAGDDEGGRAQPSLRAAEQLERRGRARPGGELRVPRRRAPPHLVSSADPKRSRRRRPRDPARGHDVRGRRGRGPRLSHPLRARPLGARARLLRIGRRWCSGCVPCRPRSRISGS